MSIKKLFQMSYISQLHCTNKCILHPSQISPSWGELTAFCSFLLTPSIEGGGGGRFPGNFNIFFFCALLVCFIFPFVVVFFFPFLFFHKKRKKIFFPLVVVLGGGGGGGRLP